MESFHPELPNMEYWYVDFLLLRIKIRSYYSLDFQKCRIATNKCRYTATHFLRGLICQMKILTCQVLTGNLWYRLI